MPGMLAERGLEAVNAEGHTALFNGGSPWADYWVRTIRGAALLKLVESGNVTEDMMKQFEVLYAYPPHWTSAICFVASWGETQDAALSERKPARRADTWRPYRV